MNITIVINNNKHNIDVSLEDTIFKIKSDIINKYFPDKDKSFWIHFIYIGNKNIREFGKHSLIIDNYLPITSDNLSIGDYTSNIENNLIFNIEETLKEEYIEIKQEQKSDQDRYVPSFKRKKEAIKPKIFVYEEDDFPALC